MVVLDAETLFFENETDWAPVAAEGELVLHGATFSAAETIARCRGAEVAITNKVPFTREVLSGLPELRCITILATGYNIIDLEAAREHGVTVCNVPGYSTDSVAQHALALLLHATNSVALHADSVQSGRWVESRQFTYMLSPIVELADLTVGLVGFGDIGERFGRILHGLGANILASRRRPADPPGWGKERFRYTTTDALFAEADVVSLHCPLTAENTGLVDRARLRTMKPTAILLNTARGGLVVEQDLADALAEGEIAGAGLDVISAEPIGEDNPLRAAPNCWITPHIAWASERARRRLLREAPATQPPPSPV
ncbi:MAG: D-2-hydroxyacid dehydrogenase, partial [Opitutales bacterium]